MIAPLPVRAAAGQGLPLALALAPALALFLAAGAAEARERTVVETLLAASNPCAALSTEVGGQAIGLDALDDVVVRSARATLDGDRLTLSLDGRLSCRAPAGAFLQGDAASDVDATAAVSLADCAAAEVQVSLSGFGGSFASLVEALRPTLEARIAEAARPQLVAACRDLRGG